MSLRRQIKQCCLSACVVLFVCHAVSGGRPRGPRMWTLLVLLALALAQPLAAKERPTEHRLVESLRRQLMQDNYDYMENAESDSWQLTTSSSVLRRDGLASWEDAGTSRRDATARLLQNTSPAPSVGRRQALPVSERIKLHDEDLLYYADAARLGDPSLMADFERSDRGERTSRVARGERTRRTDRGERTSRIDRGERTSRIDRGERTSHIDRGEWAGLVQRDEPTSLIERNERISHTDRGEQTSRIDRGEPTSLIERNERISHIDRGEQTSRIDRGEQTSRIDRGEQTSLIDRGERIIRIDRGDQTSLSDRGERINRIDRGEQTRLIDRGEQSRLIDRGEQTSLIDRGEQASLIERAEQTSHIDRGEQTSYIDHGEQSRLIEHGERTSLIDSADRIDRTDHVDSALLLPDVDTTPRYKLLNVPGGGGRRSIGGRRFVQEERPDQVAILNVGDDMPFPDFRLPLDRRQYMGDDEATLEPPVPDYLAPAPAPPPSDERVREGKLLRHRHSRRFYQPPQPETEPKKDVYLYPEDGDQFTLPADGDASKRPAAAGVGAGAEAGAGKRIRSMAKKLPKQLHQPQQPTRRGPRSFPYRLTSAVPRTTGHNQSHTTRHNQSHTTRHNQSHTTRHNQPLTTGHNKPLITGHNKPLATGHNKPLTTGHNKLLTTGHNKPLTTGHNKPLTTGHNKPLTTGHNKPLTTGHNQSHVTGHNKSHTTGHDWSQHNATHINSASKSTIQIEKIEKVLIMGQKNTSKFNTSTITISFVGQNKKNTFQIPVYLNLSTTKTSDRLTL